MNPPSASADPPAPEHAALHRRLAQLHSAMGNESTAPAAPSPRAAATSPPARVPMAGILRLTVITATFLAAGAMLWYWNEQAAHQNVVPSPPKALAAAPTPQATPTSSAKAPAAEQPAPPTATGPTLSATNEKQIRDMLETWRLDWSRRDVDAYLGHYSPEFVPAGNQSRTAWAQVRRKNIVSRPAIRIEVHELQIEPLTDKEVRLTFLQDYLSGTYQETAQPKTLQLARSESGWKIVAEWQGQGPGQQGPSK